jgi:aminoglycoside 2''-phosphotransferase
MALYKEAIQAAYPDLRIRRTQGSIPDETGQEDYRFLVNDELIFRFPTQEASVEKLEREVALQRALQERLPLPMMTPAYASQGVREVGRVFVGYVKPPGKPLYKELLESVDDEETVQRLAEELALFLSALHHLPVAEVVHLSLPEATSREALEALYARAREHLFPQMPHDRQAQFTARFEAVLDTPEPFTVAPTLVHGRFVPEAIIYQVKSRRISSITGFSRAGLGDPACDIGGLLGPRGYGEAFVRRFVPVYPEVVMLLERARFYAEVHTLEEQLRRLAAGNRKVVNQMTFYP